MSWETGKATPHHTSHQLSSTSPLGQWRKDQSIQIWRPKHKLKNIGSIRDAKASKWKLKITIFKRKRKFTQKNAATDIKFSNIQTHTHTKANLWKQWQLWHWLQEHRAKTEESKKVMSKHNWLCVNIRGEGGAVRGASRAYVVEQCFTGLYFVIIRSAAHLKCLYC